MCPALIWSLTPQSHSKGKQRDREKICRIDKGDICNCKLWICWSIAKFLFMLFKKRVLKYRFMYRISMLISKKIHIYTLYRKYTFCWVLFGVSKYRFQIFSCFEFLLLSCNLGNRDLAHFYLILPFIGYAINFVRLTYILNITYTRAGKYR